MPDANLGETIPNLMNACFGDTEQRCLSQTIILAVDEIYNEFKRRFLGQPKT